MHAVLTGTRQSGGLPAHSHDEVPTASVGQGFENVVYLSAPPRHQHPSYISACGINARVTRKCQGRGAPIKIGSEDYDGFPVHDLNLENYEVGFCSGLLYNPLYLP